MSGSVSTYSYIMMSQKSKHKVSFSSQVSKHGILERHRLGCAHQMLTESVGLGIRSSAV